MLLPSGELRVLSSNESSDDTNCSNDPSVLFPEEGTEPYDDLSLPPHEIIKRQEKAA
jgi:hypothetical protein